jgi:hypothetical protein
MEKRGCDDTDGGDPHGAGTDDVRLMHLLVTNGTIPASP